MASVVDIGGWGIVEVGEVVVVVVVEVVMVMVCIGKLG